MKKIYVTICLLFLISACRSMPASQLWPHFDDHFANIEVPEKNKIKESSIKRYFQHKYPQLWNGALAILIQHSTVLKTYRESGIIFFVDIDGVLFDKNFHYMEFPFSILIEEESEKTGVYVYPMVDLFEKDFSEKKLEIMKSAFSQKGEEFLERLSVQLGSSEKWPWLTK